MSRIPIAVATALQALRAWAASRLAADEDGQSPLIVEIAIAAVGVTLLVMLFPALQDLASSVIETVKGMIMDTTTTSAGSGGP